MAAENDDSVSLNADDLKDLDTPELGVGLEPAGLQPEAHPDDLPEQAELDAGDDEQRGKRDDELDAAVNDAERAQIRERRRRERKSRLSRANEKNAYLERTVAQLQSKVEEMGRRVAGQETHNVSSQYARLVQGEREATDMTQRIKEVIADATVKGDGATVAEATEALLNVQNRQREIGAAKQQMERAAQQPQRQGLDPEALRQAQAFAAEASWYNPQSRDPDSRVLNSLDRSLTDEGWDPKDPSYWDELRTRAKKYIPHRFGDDGGSGGGQTAYNQATQRAARSPVAGASDGGSSVGVNGAGQRTFRFSEQQKEAMQQAGLWGDEAAMKRMAKRYIAAAGNKS